MPGSFSWFLPLVLIATFSFTPKIHRQENSVTPVPSKTAAGSSESSANQRELDAMKADLQRMRSLLSQMQTNLAFVGSTTTPLNHEFELQIDMWRVLIGQTERHIQEMEETSGGNKPK